MVRGALIGLLVALSFAYCELAGATDLAGRASIIDGDTIEIHGERIRLLDMDAPESGQLCQDAAGADYRCGQRAALALSDYLGQHTVTCDWLKLDRYGRKLARCTVAGRDVGLWMVEQGLAVPYRDCKCETYRDAAEQARTQHLGLWAGTFELPWEWRKAH